MTNPLKFKNFLIVDDYEAILTMLVENLKSLGLKGKIFTASSVNEAIITLNKQLQSDFPIDLVICDIIMPQIDGVEFLKQVRTNLSFKNLPVLMLSTDNERDTVMKSIEYGASNYLLKPWTKELLLEKLLSCWEKCHGP